MTKVFQILEEEKQEAVKIAEREGKHKSQLEIAENLLKDGFDTTIIVRATGLSEEEIEKIKSSMMTTK